MLQHRALEILKTGTNVFLTGEPGAGKTHVINQYTAWLRAAGIPVAITASTGIAATHIGGVTIHSWSGVGTREELSLRDIDNILTKEYVVKRFRKSEVLIIDEISMLDGSVLDMVNQILKQARGTNKPFGNMQVVFVGDFFQLPPINRVPENVQYSFSSKAWAEAEPSVCYITEQYRHEDELLSNLLKSIRCGDVEESHYALLLEQTTIGYDEIEPTRLFTHNAKVDEMNISQLSSLPARKKQYSMKRKGNKLLVDGLIRSCLSPEKLVLAEDAMVMCTKNNFEAGYANGTLGRIIGFDRETNLPKLRTADGRVIVVRPVKWSIIDGDKTIAEIEQIPLRLAWAITVHKSQGMSLDAVEMDLQHSFVYGQGYVALSRVKTLVGLKVLGLNANALQVDPYIIRSDEKFRNQAEIADDAFNGVGVNDIEKIQRQFVREKGRTWPKSDENGSVVIEKPKSTYEETLELLLLEQSLTEMAKNRGLTEGTILAHLEWLLETKAVTADKIEKFFYDSNKSQVEEEIMFKVFKKQGISKLKPIYDAFDAEYDYLTIRLYRLLYQAKTKHRVDNKG